MSTSTKVTVLESCQVAPPPNLVSEMSHILTFGDMIYIGLSPVQRIIFYDKPVSKMDFIDTIIPKFKNSLSHALKYFPTLAGTCIIPSDSTKPRIQFVQGNFVSLDFAESNDLDFDYLVSDGSRVCSEFYPLLPKLSPESIDSGGSRMFPVLAVQVTLFPGNGFCIGIEYQHVVGDGCAMYGFMKAWAMISKLGEDEASNYCNELLPVYDRGVIADHTKELDDFVWNYLRSRYSGRDMVGVKYPKQYPDKVRSTFVITKEDVHRLKKYLLNRRSSQKHLSTFTIVCGYVWTCMVKANNVTMNNADAEATEYFECPLDFRARVEPPVPSNYFGNCLVQCPTTAKNGELSGDEGFLIAVERIGEAIGKRCKGVFTGAEKMFDEHAELNWDRMFWVAGSPRFDYYKKDFGWGTPRKNEIISIDASGAICLNGSRDGSGVPEIGVSLPKEKMEAFSRIFNRSLTSF